MASRAETNKPRVRDKVWSLYRFLDKKQPNGVIVHIDYEEQTLLVEYYDSDDMGDHHIEEFAYMFDPSFGGTWYLGGNHPLLKPRKEQTSG